MTSKWLLGTAMVSLIATGAVAQDRDLSAADPCRFETIATTDADLASAMAEFDTDDDQRISRDEYLGCLVTHGVQLNEEQRAAFMVEFDELDSDGDAYIILVDLENMQTARQTDETAQRQPAEGTDVAVEQQSAKITVTQPAATVTVTEGEAEVTVRQPEPQVEVTQRQPEVQVEQRQPKVAVEQSEPRVTVQQPEATVRVEQPEPQVQVTQSQPEVAVREGQPRVEVETVRPEVQVSQAEPEVSVSQPQPEVEVRTEQPEVRVEDAEANVEVERTAEVDVPQETARVEQPEARAAEVTTTDRVAVEVIRYEELEGRDVHNLNDEEIGDIEAVRFDPQTERPVVIIEVGGFLGLGEKELVFDIDDLTITEDRIVLDTVLSEDQLDEQVEYDEARYQDLPAEMTRR